MTLEQVYAQLLNTLRETQTPFAFIGAMGAMAWGRPRATSDLDLVVTADVSSFAALRTRLVAEGFSEGAGVGPAEPTDPLPDIAVFWAGAAPAVRVDVFIAKLDFEREVVASAVEWRVFGELVPVARPEAMLVYKLLASRPKDLLDVDSILEGRRLAGASLDWALIRRWAASWGIEDRAAELERRG